MIGIILAISKANASGDPGMMQCKILLSEVARFYPNTNRHVYKISFNPKIMQAHYVAYVQPAVSDPCGPCSRFRNDPYGINNLTNDDYIGVREKYGYDRGHLVPNADFGRDTYIISNAVPMLHDFNNGAWKNSDARIRASYSEKLILKGCDYTARYINTSRGNWLYIPMGCYFAVFDTNDINQISDLKLLDYGYFENSKVSREIKKLPTWIVC